MAYPGRLVLLTIALPVSPMQLQPIPDSVAMAPSGVQKVPEPVLQISSDANEKWLLHASDGGSTFGKQWDPEEALDEDIDAWIYCPRYSVCDAFKMFSPIKVFAEDALGRIGARTRNVSDAQKNSIRMVNGIRAAVAKGRQPLVLAIGMFWSDQNYGEAFTINVLKACSEAGAYLVVYQTEQMFDEVRHHLRYANEVSAKEMWDFSLQGARTARALNENPDIVVRYVPPGYSKNFEVGVDLFSPERREDQIGFMGQLTSRPQETRLGYEASLGAHLNQSKHVWTQEELREWCSALPLQLNTHQHSGADVGLEAFRLSPLLSNKACIISQPVLEEDMARWDGIVHFAEIGETAAKMHELQKDVRGCQERSYQKFKAAFDPLTILRSSGFLAAWQPHSK